MVVAVVLIEALNSMAVVRHGEGAATAELLCDRALCCARTLAFPAAASVLCAMCSAERRLTGQTQWPDEIIVEGKIFCCPPIVVHDAHPRFPGYRALGLRRLKCISATRGRSSRTCPRTGLASLALLSHRWYVTAPPRPAHSMPAMLVRCLVCVRSLSHFPCVDLFSGWRVTGAARRLGFGGSDIRDEK